MKLMDYHTHHRRCGHALGEIEDYVKVAIEKNFSEIGIADHFPLDVIVNNPEHEKFIRNASMKVEEFPIYIEEIKFLKKKYKNKIKVKLSTEVAFATPGRPLTMQKKVLEPFMDDFDYLIGAIHDIKWHGSSIIVLAPGQGAEALQNYEEEKITLEYIEKLMRLVKTETFDVIAHFDNHRVLFHPKEPQYSKNTWEKLLDLLDIVKNKGIAIEINTSAILKDLGSQYPIDEIVIEMIQKDIPLVLGSDAHSPKYVGFMLEKFLEKAKKWGLSHICAFKNREPYLVKIN
jgi:histidinol-phosphatase (PHP family)